MTWLLSWIVFSIIVGIGASSRGRFGIGWFLLALVITPLLAVILLLLLPSRAKSPGDPTPDTHVKCPDCAEFVRKAAKVCKHCGCKLVPQP